MHSSTWTRRHFLAQQSFGLGSLALLDRAPGNKRTDMRHDEVLTVALIACVLLWPGMGNQTKAEEVAAEWTKAETDKGYVVFAHNTLEAMPTGHVPARKAITGEVSCSLARDEYKALQFGVHAVGADGLKNIQVTVTGDLPVTVHHRWERYVDSSKATGRWEWKGKPSEWMYLQPGEAVGSVPVRGSVNFWLTFHADCATAPGTHSGKISIKVEGRPPTELALAVNVRPFQLAPARIPFGMYYTGGSLDDYRNMAAHSQNSVTFYSAGDFSQLPPKNSGMVESRIALALEAGLVHPEIPCVALQHNIYSEQREDKIRSRPEYCLSGAQRKAAADWLNSQRRSRGWPEIILAGDDEPPVPSPGLRETYTPLRSLSIRLGTAMSSFRALYEYGDLHDVWLVHDGYVTPALQAEAARLGAEVWTYTYRMWRHHYRPLPQRYYAGLYTWALRLRGNYVWSYHYNYRWPDSDERGQASLTSTGWEIRREGVDDYRYLQMVEDAVKAKLPTPLAIEAAVWLETLRSRIMSKPDIIPAGHQRKGGDHWWPEDDSVLGFSPALGRINAVTAVSGRPLDIEEFEAIRAIAADYIQKLGPVSVEGITPPPSVRLKDEAAGFRGKPVEQCIAGLADSDVSKRRAAATALFELGSQAAGAVPALLRLLDDPDVRFPALRALQAIGTEAYSAAPKVAALLSDPDDFVRHAATAALAHIAPTSEKSR